HATRDIRQTLRNAKAVLKPHGLLLLNEISRHTLFTHLTFGLLEGWWLYEDAELRLPGCPGLSSQSWQKVLEQEGFHSVSFPAQEARAVGCKIIVAASEGVVRQSRPPAAVALHPPAVGPATGVAERQPMATPATGTAHGQPTLREQTITYL